MQVRDAVLAKAAARVGGAAGASASLALTASATAGGGSGQMSEVNRHYALTQAERSMTEGGASSLAPFGGVEGGIAAVLPEAHAALQRMARTQPYYERNSAKLCSFYAKGECNRGDLCPYRHEMPRDKDDPLAKQNMLDRYHGSNDPLAAKLMGRMEARASAPPPPPPSDGSVKTIWVSGVTERVGEEDLRAAFAHFGGVAKLRVNHARGCAFVEFGGRQEAEAAVASAHTGIVCAGVPLRVNWAKPRERPAPGGPPPSFGAGGGMMGGAGGGSGGGGGSSGSSSSGSSGSSSSSSSSSGEAHSSSPGQHTEGVLASGEQDASSGLASWAAQAASLSFAAPPKR